MDYSLFVVNSILFSIYHFRNIMFKSDEINYFDIFDEIRKRSTQIYRFTFFDTFVFNIYLLAILEKIPILNTKIYPIIQYLFLFSSILNFNLSDNKKFLFIQFFNLIVMSYYTIGTDIFFSFSIRFTNNLINIFLLNILEYQIKRLEKEEVTL